MVIFTDCHVPFVSEPLPNLFVDNNISLGDNMVYGTIPFVVILLLIAILADRYNRSPIGYVLLSLVLTPLIAIIVLLVLGRRT